jgi:chemotaxis protein CheD
VAREATEITTILGSCVAICIWDPEAGIGGMNHYMLPYDIGANIATPRYASYATTMLLDQLQAAGADRRRLKAKIFGGSCILGVRSEIDHDLGAQNVRVARERLQTERIEIVEEQTGGPHGRKVVCQSATGETTVIKVSRVIS